MELDERKKRILATVVESYIESAEPVGSKQIAEEYEHEYSSATIRNEMKLLEDYGLLEQPHISAGRVPSTKGYRYYVDNLMELKKMNAEDMQNNTLSMVDIDYINNNIVSYGSIEKTLENAAEVVSKLLNLPAVLNVTSSDVLEQVKILKISEKVLLIILMSKLGTVKDVIVQITDTLPEERIDELSTLLNKNLKGTPLESLPLVLNEIVHSELKRYAHVLNELNKNMTERINETKTSVKGDITGLLALPEFSEVEDIKKFLNIMGTKDIIKEVLEKLEQNDVSVIIGSEHKEMLLKDYTLVSLDVTDDRANATLGVIAPKRVDYSKTISTLKFVNEKLRKLFNKDKE